MPPPLGANRHRRRPLAAAAVAQLRQLVRDLIERRVHVIGKLNLGHRPQAVHAHADRHADDAAFGQRRVEHSMRAEPLLQPLRRPKHAAEVAHVLAEHAHVRIALEHHLEPRPNRLNHVHRGHEERAASGPRRSAVRRLASVIRRRASSSPVVRTATRSFPAGCELASTSARVAVRANAAASTRRHLRTIDSVECPSPLASGAERLRLAERAAASCSKRRAQLAVRIFGPFANRIRCRFSRSIGSPPGQ